MVHLEDRHVIDLDSGVRWERLTSHEHEDVDFLHVIYDVGGSSASDDKMMRHPGREYGVVLEGRLGVQLGLRNMRSSPVTRSRSTQRSRTACGTPATFPSTGSGSSSAATGDRIATLVAAERVPVGGRRVQPADLGRVVRRQERLASLVLAHASAGRAIGGLLPAVRRPEDPILAADTFHSVRLLSSRLIRRTRAR